MNNKENWRPENGELIAVSLTMLFLVWAYIYAGIMFLPSSWIATIIVLGGPVAYIALLLATSGKIDMRLGLLMFGLCLAVVAVGFLEFIGIITSAVAITILAASPTMLALVITQTAYLLMVRDHGSKTSN